MKTIYRKPETECLFLNTRYSVMGEATSKGTMQDEFGAPTRSNARKLYV